MGFLLFSVLFSPPFVFYFFCLFFIYIFPSSFYLKSAPLEHMDRSISNINDHDGYNVATGKKGNGTQRLLIYTYRRRKERNLIPLGELTRYYFFSFHFSGCRTNSILSFPLMPTFSIRVPSRDSPLLITPALLAGIFSFPCQGQDKHHFDPSSFHSLFVFFYFSLQLKKTQQLDL